MALPVLSSLQSNPERYAKYFNRMTDILATLVMPLTAIVFVEADFIVRVLLGSQWNSVVPLFRILAAVGLVQGVTTAGDLVPLSMGFSRRFLRFGIARALVVSASFVAGLSYGATGVAVAYAIASYVIVIPALSYCFKGTGLSISRFLRTLLLPGALTLIATGAAVLTRHLLGHETTVSNLAAILFFGLVYLGCSCCRPLVRDTIVRVVATTRLRQRTPGRENHQ